MTRLSFPAAALAAALAAAAALTGCGGGGSSAAARIRVVDAATNAATADVIVNSASAYGDLQNGSSSPYLYIGVNSASSFTYTTTTTLALNTVALSTDNVALNDGQFYTAFLIGRPDVVRLTDGTPDARFLRVLVTTDIKPALASGQAAVRVVNAAPDIGTVTVSGIGASPLSVAYETASSYQAVAAGTLSVSAANPACTASVGCGTGGVFLPTTSVTIQAGKAYTLVVTEPTAPTGTPATGAYTYTLLTFND